MEARREIEKLFSQSHYFYEMDPSMLLLQLIPMDEDGYTPSGSVSPFGSELERRTGEKFGSVKRAVRLYVF